MSDYSEVVTPPSLLKLLTYCRQAIEFYEACYYSPHTFKSGKRKGQMELRPVKGADPLLKAGISYLRRALTDGTVLVEAGARLGMFPMLETDVTWKAKAEEEDLDPPMSKLCQRWKGWYREKLGRVEEMMCEEIPKRSIRHVGMDELLEYAVTDALGTRQLLPVLVGMQDGVLEESMEGKYD
jgi:hypothetical protein